MIEDRLRKVARPVSDIDVVPYIDVMLVLLVIFMVTAPMLHQGVSVDLPQAATQALPQEKLPPLIVSVTRDGDLFLNVSDEPEKPIVPAVLTIRMAAELKRTPSRKVLVRADKNAEYGQVMSAMVLLQRAGAPSVGLITEDERV